MASAARCARQLPGSAALFPRPTCLLSRTHNPLFAALSARQIAPCSHSAATHPRSSSPASTASMASATSTPSLRQLTIIDLVVADHHSVSALFKRFEAVSTLLIRLPAC